MATIAQIVEQIRHAIFGKDVRENIAQGIEKVGEFSDAINNKINIPQTYKHGTSGQILRTLGNGETEWSDEVDVTDKINFPETYKYGTSGQILKTLGNGKTEWSDVGNPTDEQTETAITKWLNEHPEASTTVQDGSITENKLASNLSYQLKRRYLRPFRYLFISDIHYSTRNWYSVYDDNRMKKMIDDIHKEDAANKFDGIFILGDISLDYWVSGGTADNDLISYSEKFIKYYAPKISSKLFIGPGNHDGFSNSRWKKMTGLNRQFTVIDEDKNVAIIYLDTFEHQDPEEYDDDGTYKQVDTTYLSEQLELCSGKTIFLCSHYFNYNNESSTFKEMVRTNDDIVCLLAGHTHNSRVINLGSDYGNKLLLETGHYSYAGSSAGDPENCMWGFRDVTLTSNGINSSYIVPEYTVTISGEQVQDVWHTQMLQ